MKFFLATHDNEFFVIVHSYLVKIELEKTLIVVDEEYEVGSHKRAKQNFYLHVRAMIQCTCTLYTGKSCENTGMLARVPTAFPVLPNFRLSFYNSVETWRTCFLFTIRLRTRVFYEIVNEAQLYYS